MPKVAERADFMHALQSSCCEPAAADYVRSTWPAWMPRMAFTESLSGDVLIVIFLRGAADVLNIIVPHGEQAYYATRPTLAVARPDDTKAPIVERALDLDGFFGMHPLLHPLMPIWEQGHLAPIHACGAPDESRSHFKAMELMERGVEDTHGPASGWINRHLTTLNTGNGSPLRAVGLGEAAQRSLQGAVPVSALRSISDFHLAGDPKIESLMQAGLSSLYGTEDPLGLLGQETLRILRTLETLSPDTYIPQTSYPDSEFGTGMRQIAMLVKAQVGLEVAAIDLGGWDTHFAQGTNQGLMPNLLSELAAGLAAIHEDLAEYHSKLSVVVMTEFGRRVKENASLGTDHGHGGFMLLMGGNVVGNTVHGTWPGLERDQLFGPGDLAVTTDYRDVLSEVCETRLNNGSTAQIFPEFRPTQFGFVKEG
jgi:uncharacterized protein (DUF1501 family)